MKLLDKHEIILSQNLIDDMMSNSFISFRNYFKKKMFLTCDINTLP